ncbi:hypothetical protein V6Z12_D05G274900 [Gossypium hirsutum]
MGYSPRIFALESLKPSQFRSITLSSRLPKYGNL